MKTTNLTSVAIAVLLEPSCLRAQAAQIVKQIKKQVIIWKH